MVQDVFHPFFQVTPSKKHGLVCAFVLAPASFLTFGKVNPGSPQTDILLGGGVPNPGVVREHCGRSIVTDIWEGGRWAPQTDPFFFLGRRWGLTNFLERVGSNRMVSITPDLAFLKLSLPSVLS